ncbi:MAG: winged helix-turn-helix transcriptional regulator [Candidatus Omnitrophica bacterium]|nr:winged helix-turn-helix transcriptional regulator [Candidatus Omnitrophota bacterium]
MLDEREFELVNIVGSGEGVNQRVLAERMGISLGMINLLVRRLVTKGMVRVQQLNKQKVQYLLTPKGFSEKMNKSIHYTMKTINSIGTIREKLKKLVEQINTQGESNFVVVGVNDLADLLELAFRQHFKGPYHLTKVEDLPEHGDGSHLLICKEIRAVVLEALPADKIVYVIKEIAGEEIIS